MHKGLVTWLAPAILFLWHSHSLGAPKPIVDFSIVYYEVSGRTIPEIHEAMFSNTPIRSEEGIFGGVTANTISASYDLMQTSSGCEVRNPVVHLKSTVVLPKLSDDYRSAATVREWERFISALRAHELMHAQNGHAIASTLLSRLYIFRSEQTCVAIRGRLDAAVSSLIKNMNEIDRHLDRETAHGATQGAVLNLQVR